MMNDVKAMQYVAYKQQTSEHTEDESFYEYDIY